MMNYTKPKLIRTATVSVSLDVLLRGQLAFLSTYFDVCAVSGYDSHLKIVQQREGVFIKDVPIQRNISPMKDVLSLWRLYLLFRREKPLIVHSITPKAGLLSMSAAYLARVPIRIHTFTGLVFPSKKGLLQRLLILMDKILCACATNVIPEGTGVKNDLIKYKITKKKLEVLGNGNVNGIDTTYFSRQAVALGDIVELKGKHRFTSCNFIFIFVGRLVRDKGVNELITAFCRLVDKCQSARLLLVGPYESDLDPLLPKTLELIRNSDAIITTGYKVDVRPYFAISDALVFPSHREGFPNVVIQAGAMELPCIVTDINGCNEIIQEGKNGTIIPPKDTSAIQKAMERMIDDVAWRNEMQRHSRAMIKDRYDQTIVWQSLLEEYKKLVSHV